jgi:hypothetical protein
LELSWLTFLLQLEPFRSLRVIFFDDAEKSCMMEAQKQVPCASEIYGGGDGGGNCDDCCDNSRSGVGKLLLRAPSFFPKSV